MKKKMILLNRWLKQPLIDVNEITSRLDMECQDLANRLAGYNINHMKELLLSHLRSVFGFLEMGEMQMNKLRVQEYPQIFCASIDLNGLHRLSHQHRQLEKLNFRSAYALVIASEKKDLGNMTEATF
ncbi:hypothetical protein ACJX0J_041904, partial [Zea mays]